MSNKRKIKKALLTAEALRSPIRLLIVDDSRMIRTAIKNIFTADKQINVVGEAANGKQALEMIPELKPDVITLDINMPEMNGLLTLKHIMIKHPIPTVMISSLTKEGAAETFDALRIGAIDFIAKPSQIGGDNVKTHQQNILQKIKLAAAVKMKNVRLLRTRTHNPAATTKPTATDIERCLILGASEGGYGAMLKIIPQLQPEWAAVYLGVLYTDPAYIDAFVDYLDHHSAINVKRATDGDTVQSGTCYLAAGSEYITAMEVNQKLSLRVHSSPFPKRRGAINMLMLSLSENMMDHTTGVILSGQGQDGAEGVVEIARMGGDVIIQAPQTCLFKEMAQTAIQRCQSGRILPDTHIANMIKSYFNKTLKREDELPC
jgi:two-component system chemotaxis response regulator CheB